MPDEAFKRQSAVDEAAELFATGMGGTLITHGTPIRPPAGDLKRALTTLEPGESWALKPRNIKGNPYLWTPGIKWGVTPGSFTHTTEFFGPVLWVIAPKTWKMPSSWQRHRLWSDFGIESLDQREQKQWKAGIRAGNLYINRGTTGAITLRQPFGAWKIRPGPGRQDGISRNYVAQFMNYAKIGFPPINVIQKETRLLRLAQEWRRKIEWGALPAHGVDLCKTVRAVKKLPVSCRAGVLP